MRELIVDGKFLAQKMTGVQRYALEVLRRLSDFEDLNVTVVMPKNGKIPEGDFPHCRFVKAGLFKNNLWEQWSLLRICRKMKLPLLCMGNMMPLFYKNSYVVLHDVTYRKKAFSRSALWALKYKLLVRAFVYRCKRLITVSEFSKSEILRYYPKLKKEPRVISPGGDHAGGQPLQAVDIPTPFYYSVGSINKNKNFIYILHLAKNNPDKTFVVSGDQNLEFSTFIEQNGIKNCIFTGYLDHSRIGWLYKHCEGFILPSLYEGFGLPPLEAIVMGCRNIYLSDIPVFREIYGETARFFSPQDYVQTVELTPNGISERKFEALLQKYSWQHTAQSIVDTVFGE